MSLVLIGFAGVLILCGLIHMVSKMTGSDENNDSHSNLAEVLAKRSKR
jgi:hypothetical protein